MSSGHLDRLREEMAPDPSDWAFTGRVIDTGFLGGGRCACGQEVRYEFIIVRRRDGSELVIGSHCIETSVPYLIELGAGALAGDLTDAYRTHKRELDRERRDAKSDAALQPSRDDLQALIGWYETEFHRHRNSIPAGHVLIRMPTDVARIIDQPEAGTTVGRTVGAVRKRYVKGWLHAVRYAHEHAKAPLPPLPTEPGLRDLLGERVKKTADDSTSEFSAACRFARLAYHGDENARKSVPVADGAHWRAGFAPKSRPRSARPDAFKPGGRNPRLDQALANINRGSTEAERRWEALQAARRQTSS